MRTDGCMLCPRRCGVDREKKTGVCAQTNDIRAARAALHMWEEPCISGTGGSGAVFFSGCQLHCVFCQNYNIANATAGKIITGERLVEIFLELQAQGANNINLVTPDIYAPQLVWALTRAKDSGLTIPIVYNTSSYVAADTLRMLEGLVDVYLPDLKFYSREMGKRYANAPDYFTAASAAIAEMQRQAGEPQFYFQYADGSVQDAPKGMTFEQLQESLPAENPPQVLMKRGVIVRHLQLPGGLADSRRVLRYLYETYGNRIYYSILSQYTPVVFSEKYKELNRRLTDEEYGKLVDYAVSLGIVCGFVQEEEASQESFIPEFDGAGL